MMGLLYTEMQYLHLTWTKNWLILNIFSSIHNRLWKTKVQCNQIFYKSYCCIYVWIIYRRKGDHKKWVVSTERTKFAWNIALYSDKLLTRVISWNFDPSSGIHQLPYKRYELRNCNLGMNFQIFQNTLSTLILPLNPRYTWNSLCFN